MQNHRARTRGACLRGEKALELGPRVLGGDDDDLRVVEAADAPVDLLRHAPQMLLRQLVDVPLPVRLRPAALVVTARLSLREVRELLEAPGP